MRGKAKQRVSLILVVTMVLGTVLTGNTVLQQERAVTNKIG